MFCIGTLRCDYQNKAAVLKVSKSRFSLNSNGFLQYFEDDFGDLSQGDGIGDGVYAFMERLLFEKLWPEDDFDPSDEARQLEGGSEELAGEVAPGPGDNGATAATEGT